MISQGRSQIGFAGKLCSTAPLHSQAFLPEQSLTMKAAPLQAPASLLHRNICGHTAGAHTSHITTAVEAPRSSMPRPASGSGEPCFQGHGPASPEEVDRLVEDEIAEETSLSSGGRVAEEADAQAEEEAQQLEYLAFLAGEAEVVAILRAPGDPCFKACPDAEVEWWVERLLQVPIEEAAHLWKRIPLFSQYIFSHDVSEVAADCLAGVEGLKENAING